MTTDRGVSTVVSYVILLGIVAILVSGLIGGVAPVVMNQQASSAQSTAAVVAHDLAGDLESADRLAIRNGESGTVVVHSRLPDRIGGSEYTIEIVAAPESDSTFDIIITIDETEHRSIVSVRTTTDLAEYEGEDALSGGHLVIEHDPEAGELVIKHV